MSIALKVNAKKRLCKEGETKLLRFSLDLDFAESLSFNFQCKTCWFSIDPFTL